MKVRQIGRRRKIHRVFTMEQVLITACLFFLSAAVLIICIVRTNSEGRIRMGKKIWITAHRGASYGAPENTKAAIELAIVEQADYAEIDVRLTKDGIPVLMHDRALFRTTGIANKIDQLTYAELLSYDAGRKYAEEFAGEVVPCLQEVLEAYGDQIKFNIELKGGNDRTLAGTVITLIEKYGLEEQCVVSSAFYEQLEWVKKENKKIRTGYILPLVYGEVFGYDAADFFSVRSDSVTEQLVRGAHAKGKEVHAWTVNKSYEIKRMQEVGVDNIITDKPAYVRDLLR